MIYMFFESTNLVAILITFLFFGVFSGIHYLAALGARRGKSWGRLLSRVIGAFLLLGFPIGTVIGVLLLIGTGNMWESDNAVPTTS